MVVRRRIFYAAPLFAACFLALIFTGCSPSIRYTRDQPSTPPALHPHSDSTGHKPVHPAPKGSQKHLEYVIAAYLGVPYKYGGMTMLGLDCSGFVSLVYREVYDKPLPRSSGKMWEAGHRVPPAAAKPGDLVFFRNGFGPIDHVGIYMGGNRFAHSSSSSGVIYSDLGETYYARRFAGIMRMM